jgi:hypothetical protein
MLAINSWVITRWFEGRRSMLKQQPAAQLLVQRMVPVAHRRLRHLGQQRLGVAQQQALHRAGAKELVLQQL